MVKDNPEDIEKIYGAAGDDWKYAKMADGSWKVMDTAKPNFGWLTPSAAQVKVIEAQLTEEGDERGFKLTEEPLSGEPVEIEKSEIEDLATIKGKPVEIDKGDIEDLSQMQKGEIAIDKGELESLARMQAHGENKEKSPTDMLKPDYGAKLVMDTLKGLLISPEERQGLIDRAAERRKMFWDPQAYEAPKREKK